MWLKSIKILALALLQLFTFICSLLVIYLSIVMLAMMIPVGGGAPQADDVRIYVRSNGVHTDFWLPVKTAYIDWTDFISVKDYPGLSEYKFVSMGWGDKAFYIETPQWSDLTLSTAFNAAFLEGPSAMHVQYFAYEPRISPSSVALDINEQSYFQLIDYIKSSFEQEHGQPKIIEGATYWGTDRFYEGKGNYHLFNTCNNWTNEGLKSIGVRTASFAIFPKTILTYLEEAPSNPSSQESE